MCERAGRSGPACASSGCLGGMKSACAWISGRGPEVVKRRGPGIGRVPPREKGEGVLVTA